MDGKLSLVIFFFVCSLDNGRRSVVVSCTSCAFECVDSSICPDYRGEYLW